MADMYGVEEEELTNQQKAAVLFIALGPEYSAKLFSSTWMTTRSSA